MNMGKIKKRIPKEVLKELDITKIQKIKPEKVNLIVEEHQVRIPIPRKIRLRMDLKKSKSCLMTYDKNKKELICKF